MIVRPPFATPAAGALLAANNLSDIGSIEAVMRNLALYPMFSTRAVRDTLYFDGLTVGGVARWPEFTGSILGLSDFSVGVKFKFPAAAKGGGSHYWLWNIGPAFTTTDPVTGVSLSILNAGNFRLQFIESAGVARSYDTATTMYTTYGGVWRDVVVKRVNGVAYLFVDGVSLTLTPTDSGVPSFAGAAYNIPTGAVFQGARNSSSANNSFTGSMEPVFVINAALSDTEILTYVKTGMLPSWCYLAVGSMTPIMSPTVLNGGFETAGGGGADIWATWTEGTITGTGALADEAAIVNSGAHAAKLSTGAGGTAAIRASIGLIPGRKYRVEFYARDDGSAAALTVESDAGSYGTAVAALTAGYTKYSFEFVANNGAIIIKCAQNNKVVYVDDVTITLLGQFTLPVIQACRIIDDAGANGNAGVITSGVTPVTNRKEWRMRAVVDMSGTGNKQLFGAAVFDTPQNQALDSIDTECAGTPTFSIGDGTTATKYTASVAHTATRLRETLSANYPADSAKTGIYANVTVAGGATEKITIRGHRTD